MAISAPSYKVIIIGNSGVGKTTLFHRILFDTFVDTRSNKETTIFLDCYEKTMSISGKEIKIDVHDCQGRERFRTRNINNLYHRADVALLTFSLADVASFEDLNTWIEECKDNLWGNSEDLLWAVIGNKSDLKSHEVDMERVKKLCDNLETDYSFIVSAKTGQNVGSSFKKVIEAIHQQRTESSKNSIVTLDDINGHNKCC